jgi:hypothetical protein
MWYVECVGRVLPLLEGLLRIERERFVKKVSPDFGSLAKGSTVCCMSVYCCELLAGLGGVGQADVTLASSSRSHRECQEEATVFTLLYDHIHRHDNDTLLISR